MLEPPHEEVMICTHDQCFDKNKKIQTFEKKIVILQLLKFAIYCIDNWAYLRNDL